MKPWDGVKQSVSERLLPRHQRASAVETLLSPIELSRGICECCERARAEVSVPMGEQTYELCGGCKGLVA
jgi:hypothetical protein